MIDKDDDDDIVATEMPIVGDVVETQADTSDDILDEEVSAEASEDLSDFDDEVEAGSYNDENLGDQNELTFDTTTVDMRGETADQLRRLIEQDFDLIGGPALDARVREVGSWENIVFRSIRDVSFEELRIQNFLATLRPEDRAALKSEYRDPETNKLLLRSSAIVDRSGVANERKHVSGDEALMAFENLQNTKGGAYRIPLYNSGISIDVITPTGNDLQTMITNCLLMDQELGSGQGAHYFAYNDLLYKTQILNFLQPLIVNSSYIDWRKKGALWSIIKLPDLSAILMNIAAMCYKDGFDNFVVRCSREKSDEHPDLCRHTETFTANLFSMIVSRFSVMSKSAIDFMVNTRKHAVRNTLTQIAQYQAELGFEGEKVSFGDLTFVMRIPTLAEYQEAGSQFIADITNEIQGDNNAGQYEQVGFRYMRVFLPWIGSLEGVGPKGEVYVTSDTNTIRRALERLDHQDTEGKVREKLRDYINRVQLTYVGHPATPCPKCGHVADTPSGMLTIDPFSAFFTLALRYTTPS